MFNKLTKKVAIFLSLTSSLIPQLKASCPDSFNDMKNQHERDGWNVVWSESYGFGSAATLAACTYLGCAESYLNYEFDQLVSKIGRQAVDLIISNKGDIFNIAQNDYRYGLAFYSVSHQVGSACVTTERYIRLYFKYRKTPPNGTYIEREGIYRDQAGGIHYAREGHYCKYAHMEAYLKAGGHPWVQLSTSQGIIGHNYDGECAAPGGYYRIPSGDIYYSNGRGEYCHMNAVPPSWDNWPRMPQQMVFNGSC